VLIGNEGQGLSKQAVEICDGTVHIPIRNAESLNAAVAASVLLWEMSKGRAL
jgi:TrmH family RNA methyltransferase